MGHSKTHQAFLTSGILTFCVLVLTFAPLAALAGGGTSGSSSSSSSGLVQCGAPDSKNPVTDPNQQWQALKAQNFDSYDSDCTEVHCNHTYAVKMAEDPPMSGTNFRPDAWYCIWVVENAKTHPAIAQSPFSTQWLNFFDTLRAHLNLVVQSCQGGQPPCNDLVTYIQCIDTMVRAWLAQPEHYTATRDELLQEVRDASTACGYTLPINVN